MTGTTERRPIAAREAGASRALAAWLVRRQASPDGISLAGMAAAVAAGLAFAAAPATPVPRALWLAGALLVQVRLLANMLDGMVAIGRNVASPLGELFNEVPDRVSDTAVLFGLGWAAGQPALGLAAALAAMATAYVRAVGRASGAASDFRGPMAKQHRMALVTATALWCALAPASWSAPVPGATLWLIAVLALVTAWRRLAGTAAALRRAGATPR